MVSGVVALEQGGEEAVARMGAGQSAEVVAADGSGERLAEDVELLHDWLDGKDGRWNLLFGENGFDDLLTLFGLKRAGGVEQTTSRREARKSGLQNAGLTGGVASEVGGSEAVANLWIACEGAGAAARDVGEDEIEVFECVRRVGRVGCLYRDVCGVGILHEACPHAGETTWADVSGEDLCLWEAMGENEGLAAGRGAGIPDARSFASGRGCEFRHESRAVVDLRECGAGLFCKERGHGRFGLISFADFDRCGATVVCDPAFDEPLRVAEPLGEGGGALVEAAAGGLCGG